MERSAKILADGRPEKRVRATIFRRKLHHHHLCFELTKAARPKEALSAAARRVSCFGRGRHCLHRGRRFCQDRARLPAEVGRIPRDGLIGLLLSLYVVVVATLVLVASSAPPFRLVQATQELQQSRDNNNNNNLSAIVCNSRCKCLILIASKINNNTHLQANNDTQQLLEQQLLAFQADFSELDDDHLEYNSERKRTTAANGTSGNGDDSESAETPTGSDHRPTRQADQSTTKLSNASQQANNNNNSASGGFQRPEATASRPHQNKTRATKQGASFITDAKAYPFAAAATFNQQQQTTTTTTTLNLLRAKQNNPARKMKDESDFSQLGAGNIGDDLAMRRRHKQQTGADASLFERSGRWENLEQILPLATFDMSQKLRRKTTTTTTMSLANNISSSILLSKQVAKMMLELEAKEALNLSNNSLEFELWTEIYALLALGPMRKNLLQLDLSHNSLTKLGVTFTGYIEHHLLNARRTSGAKNESLRWPFIASTTTTAQTLATNESGDATSKPRLTLNSLRHQPILGDGRLFNAVLMELEQTNLTILHSSNNTTSTRLTTTTTTTTTTNATDDQQQPWLTSSGQQTSILASNQYVLLQIRALDLSHNKLKWLISDQFRAIRRVQAIRLDHNKLRFIPQQAFNGLEALKYLNLNSNRLQTIYIEQFQTNYNLLALSVRSNYLAYLRAGSFVAQSNLKRLDLSRNKFTIMSNNAFVGLDSLELLNCSTNQFVHVPSASLHPMPSLKRLDLSDNQFSQLAPGAFFHLPIEELELNENDQLVSIERGAFWDLPYLKRLSLRSNQVLISINSQAFVGAGENLRIIDIDDCPMLSDEARQMLENVTLAATSRQLLNDDGSTLASSIEDKPQIASNTSSPSPNDEATPPTASVLVNKRHHNHMLHQVAVQQQQQQQQQAVTRLNFASQVADASKFLYTIGSVVLILILLNLILRYTSTRRYLSDAHRRRRRIYQASSTSFASSSSSTCSQPVASGPNCEHDNCQSCDSRVATPSSKQLHSSSGQSSSGSRSASLTDDRRSCTPDNDLLFGEHEQAFEMQERNTLRNCDEEEELSKEEEEVALELEETYQDNLEVELAHGQIGLVGADHDRIPSPAFECLIDDCPDCRQQQQIRLDEDTCCSVTTGPQEHQVALIDSTNVEPQENLESNQQMALVHDQLVNPAGFELGHENCAHFCHSLTLDLDYSTKQYGGQIKHDFY